MRAHALGVVHAVRDVHTAERFFHEVLDMPTRQRGEGWALIDNGSTCVRLVRAACPPAVLTMELVHDDLERFAGEVVAHPGVSVATPVHWASTYRQEMTLRAPHDLVLVVARQYNEDQLGIVPPLPCALEWDEEATRLAQELLTFVPVALRRDARRQVTAEAEDLALRDGRVEVVRGDAVHALVDRTPSFQLRRLSEELVARGIDVDPWRARLEGDTA